MINCNNYDPWIAQDFLIFFYRLLWESNQISRYESLKEKSIHNQMSSRFHDPEQFPLLHEKNRFCVVF